MSQEKSFTVLIAPLDWGLGHATRCIPIIQELLKLQCKVIIVSNGQQHNLLKTEFPQLYFIVQPGYNIHYSKHKRLFNLKIIWQIPKILKAIRNERKWLTHFVSNNKLDLIIADNRYGLHSKDVFSVFITHQLTIKSNNLLVEYFLQKINYFFIKQFDACWIPDEKGAINFAGLLSHPNKLPDVQISYLGALSRFQHTRHSHVKYKLLIMLSGPEPQRSLLEQTLLKQIEYFKQPVLFVRGLPGTLNIFPDTEFITFRNHLTAREMEQAFSDSAYIISRSGYTTVMDIAKLQKKSILIPTPGQTEQEYLARHLQQQGFCIAASQDSFNLNKELLKAENFSYRFPHVDMAAYKKVLEQTVKSIS